MDEQSLKNCLQAINGFTTHPYLSSLVQNLSATMEAMKKENSMISHKNQEISVLGQEHINNVNITCQKIKQRQVEVLLRTLNTKSALSDLMQHSRKTDTKRNTILHDRMEKIKRLKTELSSKLHNIKINNDRKFEQKRQRTNNDQPLKIILKELRDGTELIQIESMKAREEMALLVERLSRDIRTDYRWFLISKFEYFCLSQI